MKTKILADDVIKITQKHLRNAWTLKQKVAIKDVEIQLTTRGK